MAKIGIVGLGFGSNYGLELLENKNADFVAMCARSQKTLDEKGALFQEKGGKTPNGYLSVEEMLSKETLDGVIIVTPSSTHHEFALKVATAGVNILIDKPIDINEENIKIIKDAVVKNNVMCGVIYPYRCKALINGLKKVVEDQLLGKPLYCDLRMKVHRTQEYYESNGSWRGTWEIDGGGSLMNQGAHPVDILCYVFGKPKSVVGSYGILNHDIKTEDWASGIIEFESGVRATIGTTTCAGAENESNRLEFQAQDGYITLEGGAITASNFDKLDELVIPPFSSCIHDFVDALNRKRPPMVSIEDATWSVKLIQGIYQSCREGRLVEID